MDEAEARASQKLYLKSDSPVFGIIRNDSRFSLNLSSFEIWLLAEAAENEGFLDRPEFTPLLRVKVKELRDKLHGLWHWHEDAPQPGDEDLKEIRRYLLVKKQVELFLQGSQIVESK